MALTALAPAGDAGDRRWLVRGIGTGAGAMIALRPRRACPSSPRCRRRRTGMGRARRAHRRPLHRALVASPRPRRAPSAPARPPSAARPARRPRLVGALGPGGDRAREPLGAGRRRRPVGAVVLEAVVETAPRSRARRRSPAGWSPGGRGSGPAGGPRAGPGRAWARAHIASVDRLRSRGGRPRPAPDDAPARRTRPEHDEWLALMAMLVALGGCSSRRCPTSATRSSTRWKLIRSLAP